MKCFKSSMVLMLVYGFTLAGVPPIQAQQQQQQQQQQHGKWTLNSFKSKFSGNAPKEQTQKYEAQGEATKVTVVGVDANGNSVAYDYVFTPDGKIHPVVAAMPNGADSVEVKQIDANTIETNFMKGGKVIETTRTEASKDGKQLTITSMKTAPDGRQVKDVMVFDKSSAA